MTYSLDDAIRISEEMDNFFNWISNRVERITGRPSFWPDNVEVYGTPADGDNARVVIYYTDYSRDTVDLEMSWGALMDETGETFRREDEERREAELAQFRKRQEADQQRQYERALKLVREYEQKTK